MKKQKTKKQKNRDKLARFKLRATKKDVKAFVERLNAEVEKFKSERGWLQ